MHLHFLLSPVFLALTIAALPSTNPLDPRFNLPYTPSRCFFNPHFLGYRTKFLTHEPAKAEVTITDKTTEEKGDVGSGLHDNLIGECGRDEITNWQNPTVLATERWTARVTAYNVWFDVGATEDQACIERAILKAEGQNVTCTPF